MLSRKGLAALGTRGRDPSRSDGRAWSFQGQRFRWDGIPIAITSRRKEQAEGAGGRSRQKELAEEKCAGMQYR